MKRYRFLLPIVAIIFGGTIIYMFIYAHNPFREFVGVFSAAVEEPLLNQPAPEIIGITDWINVSSVSPRIADLRGNVVLVEFWTYACINCIRSVPKVVEWDEKYRDQRLKVIGVHTPEFRYEQKLENVEKAVTDFGIEYPVALDNGYATWSAYNNLYWPALYLIDKQGVVRYIHYGEGAYEKTEQKIIELLAQ